MVHSDQLKDQFLYSRNRYYGSYTPDNLVFNANLQELAQKISILSALHTGGKLSSTEAFEQIEPLWQQLVKSQKTLNFNP